MRYRPESLPANFPIVILREAEDLLLPLQLSLLLLLFVLVVILSGAKNPRI
jgi:hypothetical protein